MASLASLGGLVSLRAQNALPVINSPSTISGSVDQPWNYTITATNSPTSYFAWLPRDFTINPATGVISGRARFPYQPSSGGGYLYATNASGTIGRSVTLAMSVPSVPWLADIAANNDEPLVVGEPWVGGVTTYDSAGRPSSGLTFSADGLPPGLSLSGGTISGTPTTTGSFPVVLRATGAIGTASRTTTLTVAPAYAASPSRVTRITLPGNGVYVASLSCSFQVHFSRPVLITGSPRLAVTVGTTTRYATWGGPPLSAGPFTPTQIPLAVQFQPEDFDTDGITIASSLDLNGGSIKDTDGNTVDVSFTPGDTRGVLVAPIPPPAPRILAVNQTATALEITGLGSGDVVVSRSGAGVLGTVACDAEGKWTFNYATPSPANGDYTFTARGKLRNAPIYGEESAAFTKTIAAAPAAASQTITFPAMAEKTYGDPPVVLNASASSGLPVSYTVISGNGVVSGNSVTLSGGGAIVIEATQPGNDTYAAAAPVRQTLTVKPQTATISVPSQTVVFTGFSQSVGPIVSNPPMSMNDGSDRLILSYNGQTINPPGATPTNTAMLEMLPRGAGVYSVRVDVYSPMHRYTGTGTGTLTITRMPVTVTLGNLTQAYDGAAKSVSVATTPTEVYYPSGSLPMTRYLKITYNGSTSAPSEPGSYEVVATVDSPDVTGVARGTLTIASSGQPQAPPPVSNGTPPSTPITTPTTPQPSAGGTTPPARNAQSIEFLAPVSAPVMGQPIPLGATSSAGLPITYAVVSGSATIRDNVLVVTGPGPVVVRASQAGNETTAPASAEITIGDARRMTQSISFAPPSSKLSNDAPFALAATATSGLPVAFTLVSGPASLSGDMLTLTGAPGTVVVRAAQAGNETTEPIEVTRTITVEAAPSSRLANVSARLQVSDGDANRTFISGFVVAGTAAQRVLIRATGPALAAFGVQTPLANPRLRLFDAAGRLIEENDDWNGADIAATAGQVGAFPLSAGSRDAAILRTLSPGAYTVHIMAGGESGVALAEIFDASDPTGLARPPLANLSTRGYVDSGEAQMGAGFVIAGTIAKRVLIRAVGPTLGSLGVTGALRDPILTVYKTGAIMAQNDDWETALPLAGVVKPAGSAEIPAATAASGAFALPAGSRDSALVLTLAPGAYTALVSGANGATGVALVEVYELP